MLRKVYGEVISNLTDGAKAARKDSRHFTDGLCIVIILVDLHAEAGALAKGEKAECRGLTKGAIDCVPLPPTMRSNQGVDRRETWRIRFHCGLNVKDVTEDGARIRHCRKAASRVMAHIYDRSIDAQKSTLEGTLNDHGIWVLKHGVAGEGRIKRLHNGLLRDKGHCEGASWAAHNARAAVT